MMKTSYLKIPTHKPEIYHFTDFPIGVLPQRKYQRIMYNNEPKYQPLVDLPQSFLNNNKIQKLEEMEKICRTLGREDQADLALFRKRCLLTKEKYRQFEEFEIVQQLTGTKTVRKLDLPKNHDCWFYNHLKNTFCNAAMLSFKYYNRKFLGTCLAKQVDLLKIKTEIPLENLKEIKKARETHLFNSITVFTEKYGQCAAFGNIHQKIIGHPCNLNNYHYCDQNDPNENQIAHFFITKW